MLGLAIALAPVFTWKLLTDISRPALTGRRWLADGSSSCRASIFLSAIAAVLAGTSTHLDPRATPPARSRSGWLAILRDREVYRGRRGIPPGPGSGIARGPFDSRLLAVGAVIAVATLDAGPPAHPAGILSGPSARRSAVNSLHAAPRPLRPGTPGAGLEPASVGCWRVRRADVFPSFSGTASRIQFARRTIRGRLTKKESRRCRSSFEGLGRSH